MKIEIAANPSDSTDGPPCGPGPIWRVSSAMGWNPAGSANRQPCAARLVGWLDSVCNRQSRVFQREASAPGGISVPNWTLLKATWSSQDGPGRPGSGS